MSVKLVDMAVGALYVLDQSVYFKLTHDPTEAGTRLLLVRPGDLLLLLEKTEFAYVHYNWGDWIDHNLKFLVKGRTVCMRWQDLFPEFSHNPSNMQHAECMCMSKVDL